MSAEEPRGAGDPGGAGRSGTLYVVATPIGNLEDMTYRAVRVLGEVDMIAAEDTRAAERLVAHFGIARRPVRSFFEGNEARRTEELVEALRSGRSVALISEAGTPAVSDPGQRLVSAAVSAGIRVVPIPGPSAAIAALVASGLPSDRFLFVGFPPRDPGPRASFLGSLRTERATLILYESPPRVGATLTDLVASFGGSRPAALCRELTKVHEQVIRAPLSDLAARFAETAPRGECTLVIAGAPPDLAEPALDLEAEITRRLEQGMSPKDIAARLALTTGKPRRTLYQLALSLGQGGQGHSRGQK